MKTRVKTEDGLELSTICRQLKMRETDGKMRETDAANVPTLLRIIQSIPSPKAEPFKQWLAQVGYERIEETEDPELSFDRAMETKTIPRWYLGIKYYFNNPVKQSRQKQRA